MKLTRWIPDTETQLSFPCPSKACRGSYYDGAWCALEAWDASLTTQQRGYLCLAGMASRASHYMNANLASASAFTADATTHSLASIASAAFGADE